MIDSSRETAPHAQGQIHGSPLLLRIKDAGNYTPKHNVVVKVATRTSGHDPGG